MSIRAGRGLIACASMMALAGTAMAAEEAKEAPSSAPAATQETATPPGATSAWSAKVAPDKDTSGISLDEKQTELIKQVSAYFSDIKNLKGAFVQTNADNKRMRGKFYVKRPGRFRFDYNLPSKQIIISDGDYVAIQDHDLNNEDRVALDQTPFRLLLRNTVDLLRDANIVEVQEADGLIVVALQDKSPDTPGRIKLFLATKPSLEIKEWVTTDAQGLDTRVQVSDLDKSVDLDTGLFKIQGVGTRKGVP